MGESYLPGEEVDLALADFEVAAVVRHGRDGVEDLFDPGVGLTDWTQSPSQEACISQSQHHIVSTNPHPILTQIGVGPKESMPPGACG